LTRLAPDWTTNLMRPRVIFTQHVPAEHLSPLEGVAEVILGPVGGELMSRAEVLRLLPTVAGIINQGEIRVDEELLQHAAQLRVVANVSLGTDNLDLPALTRRGIWATNLRDQVVDSTADCALGLMLAVTRRLVEADAFVRSGAWSKFEPGRWDGPQIGRRVVGIVGFGRIGQAVGRRAEAFGARVIHHTRTVSTHPGYRTLEALVAEADIVCVCLPMNPDSKGMFDARRFAQMKKGAVFINVGRGKIMDEAALVAALESGHLYGAGLDVFENEPAVNPALIKMKQVVMTPHLGGGTIESRRAARQFAAANVAAVLQGKRPLTPVNEPLLV
jgi:glyoxylate reductase